MYHPPTKTRFAYAGIAMLLIAAVAVPSVQATHNTSYDCEQDGKNTQCNEFGQIAMDTQTDIRGEPKIVTIDAVVSDTHADQGARYIMFSVRHDNAGAPSPVSLSLESFESKHGDIFVERIDHDIPNEINIWTHVADVPEDTPITIKVKVGVNDRGAFRLESLVMPFDRGYEPLTDGNDDISMFSFTTLGVNKETAAVGGSSSFTDRLRTPGLGAMGALAAIGAALVVMARRRQG